MHLCVSSPNPKFSKDYFKERLDSMVSNNINNANCVVSTLTVAGMAWGYDNVWSDRGKITCTTCGMCEPRSGYQILFSCPSGIRAYIMNGIKTTDIDFSMQIEQSDRERDLATNAVRDEVLDANDDELEHIVVDVDVHLSGDEDGEEDNS